MILSDRWAAEWIGAWNARNLDNLLEMYAETVVVRSPLAKLYAGNGLISGKAELRVYWGEAMRRMPNLKLELMKAYSGHLTLAIHYRDGNGRQVIETVLFDDQDKVVMETSCHDRPR